MTTELRCRPLISRFAERITRDKLTTYRYDSARQVSQVWNGSGWVDALGARNSLAAETLVTKVTQETTDDS